MRFISRGLFSHHIPYHKPANLQPCRAVIPWLRRAGPIRAYLASRIRDQLVPDRDVPQGDIAIACGQWRSSSRVSYANRLGRETIGQDELWPHLSESNGFSLFFKPPRFSLDYMGNGNNGKQRFEK
ncbi:hypothetical protein NKJ66_27220 [Mesorhizobium sp. M0078]|uniref:hypothetical protein n=1 Tax=Mesorhizobium sp. M0078 TaxID=2956871 RepID=UPI00333870FB